MCLAVSVTFCEEMEQSCWLAPCSISAVAHRVNRRECPFTWTPWDGWVDVQHPAVLLLLLAKASVAAFKHCTLSLENLDLFRGVSILQCNGTLYSTTLCRMLSNCSITI